LISHASICKINQIEEHNSIKKFSCERKYITLNIDAAEKPINLIIDTASPLSIIIKQALKPNWSILETFKTKICGIAKGNSIESLGIITACCKIARFNIYLELNVVDKNDINLENHFSGLLNSVKINAKQKYLTCVKKLAMM
jgi:hypothetical protein